MNNIVKIILGLNVLAAGVGIFFGVSKSGEVDEIKRAKIVAEDEAKSSVANENKIKMEKVAALTAISLKDGEITSLKAQLQNMRGGFALGQRQLDQANEAIVTAQKAAAKANLDLKAAQKIANQVPPLKGRIAAYENLGAPQGIKTKLDKLAKLEAASLATIEEKKPKKIKPGEVGRIQTHNPTYDYYVVNVGSDNGLVKGDKFTIFRGPKALGKIEINRVRPTVSIAIYDRAFPRPAAPFKSGDRVMKMVRLSGF